jgi:cytosine/adenosine deaminase-related metal-dependent hydrolase
MAELMLIEGARVAVSSAEFAHRSLSIRGERIIFAPIPPADKCTLDLQKYVILPGLINAHDHLELNLFPKLGRGHYPNALTWARDIYRPDERPVKRHLGVPKDLRLRWGGIKNLLSGVTTVAHHNDFHPVLRDPTFPVRVISRYGWAHSIDFSPDWKIRFEKTPRNQPFIIHAGEGTDSAASLEIETLAQAGALNRSTILVHGVGLNRNGLGILQRAGSSLVWCPSSNHFTLGESLHRHIIESGIRIVLGSDSALTAAGDLLDELRFAQKSTDAHRLYKMVTLEAARILQLPFGFGQIRDDGPADLLVMKDTGRTPAATLLHNYPELVISRGRIALVSLTVAALCPPSRLAHLEPITVEGRGTYLIAEKVRNLLARTANMLDDSVRLAGKAIAA